MPFRAVSVARFHFGGYDPGIHTTSVAITLALDALDTTALVDVAERATGGIRKDLCEWSGLFSDSTKALNSAAALVGTGTHVLSLHIGTATGDIAYLGTAFLMTQPRSMNLRELVREEAGFSLDGTWNRGVVLYTQTQATGSATGGAVDGTASSTAGGTYNVHVMQISTGTLNLIWESATTATGVYTVLASANITTVTGTLLNVGSGTTIARFVRHRHTNTVATGTFDIAAGFARA